MYSALKCQTWPDEKNWKCGSGKQNNFKYLLNFYIYCRNFIFCLQEEFGYNAETQKLLSKNGEALLAAINFFISSVNTLVDKTIEDTMLNIKQYEVARYCVDQFRACASYCKLIRSHIWL